MDNKQKQRRADIYEDIYDVLIKTDDFENHGLSFAVNAALARHLNLPIPATPSEKMKRAASRLGKDKNITVITLPADWTAPLEKLIAGERWYRKENPELARVCEKAGLISFVQRLGAVPTETLSEIWNGSNRRQKLLRTLEKTVSEMGYRIEFI